MNKYLDYITRIPHLSTLGRLFGIHLALNCSDEGWVETTVQKEMRWCECTEFQLQNVLFELEREEIARAYVQPAPPGAEQTIVWRLVLPHENFPHREIEPAENRRARIFAKTGGVCFYCMDATAEHLDHMHPASRGGRDDIENMIGACATCNVQKRDRTVEEYRAYLAYKRRLSSVSDVVFFGDFSEIAS